MEFLTTPNCEIYIYSSQYLDLTYSCGTNMDVVDSHSANPHPHVVFSRMDSNHSSKDIPVEDSLEQLR